MFSNVEGTLPGKSVEYNVINDGALRTLIRRKECDWVIRLCWALSLELEKAYIDAWVFVSAGVVWY